MIPVIFLQIWRPCNVKTAISLASAKNEVHLIGDADYSEGACAFHNVRQWDDRIKLWLSSQTPTIVGGEDFETLCMYRWLCILALIKELGSDFAWCCDSDVLVYSNAEEEHKRLGSPQMTFSQCPEGRAAGLAFPLGHAGHSIIARTVLERFVARKHARWNDMFAWSAMLLEESVPFVDTAATTGNRVWDHHLGNDLSNYESDRQYKHVWFKDNMPVLKHKRLGELVTPVLHCWTPAEPKMDHLAGFNDL